MRVSLGALAHSTSPFLILNNNNNNITGDGFTYGHMAYSRNATQTYAYTQANLFLHYFPSFVTTGFL